jgi:hypothetical protein
MPSIQEVLYISDVSEQAVNTALSATLDTFHTIQEADEQLTRPIIDRDLVAVVVALKPAYEGPIENKILAIAQFALKATSRAFAQYRRAKDTDVVAMEKLASLPNDKLYEASSASVNGLHVGFAGGWAHHGRLLAVSFANSLSNSLGLVTIDPVEMDVLDEQESTARLAWLNEGIDSGDNTPEHASAREQYRFIFSKIVSDL